MSAIWDQDTVMPGLSQASLIADNEKKSFKKWGVYMENWQELLCELTSRTQRNALRQEKKG